MKPISKWLLLLCLLAATNMAFGQFGSSSTLIINNPSIETVGGVTYLKFSYETTCPDELWRSSSDLVGTNVSVTLHLIPNYNLACILIFPPPVSQNQASLVLGSFQPGDYACRIHTDLFGQPFVQVIPFTVPAPTPMLSISPMANGRVALDVKGTSNVTYQVQSSSNLTNWATIRTSIGGPFKTTNAPAGNMFYRVKVSDITPVIQ
jgi:hypothetical protein